jgi:hypothetical protein
MKNFVKITTLAAGCILSQNAFAILDIQAAIGKKTGTFTPDSSLAAESSVGGQAFQAAAHFHVLPIPMFTLGIGLGLSTFSSSDKAKVAYTGSDATVATTASLDEITGLSVGPDIIFGVSIPATDLMPFLRYNYALNVWKGKATLEVAGQNQTFDAALKGTGSIIGLGLAWSPIPLVAITGEYQMQNDTLSVPEVKTSGGINFPEAENKFKSSTLLVGAMFNL